MGIVLPDAGYWEAATRLIKSSGALLVLDETHTFSAGPGGCTKLWGLKPDIITMGKSIAGGVPIGAYGVTAEIEARIHADRKGDYIDTGGCTHIAQLRHRSAFVYKRVSKQCTFAFACLMYTHTSPLMQQPHAHQCRLIVNQFS